MQEHPHAEIAQSLWSAVADGDAEALEEILAPDIVWTTVGRSRISGEYHGPAAVIEYLATIGELTDNFVSTLEQVYVGDEGAVIVHRANATRDSQLLDMRYFIRMVIDEDGITGSITNFMQQCVDDPDDSILEAEIKASRLFLDSLSPDNSRVALIDFSGAVAGGIFTREHLTSNFALIHSAGIRNAARPPCSR